MLLAKAEEEKVEEKEAEAVPVGGRHEAVPISAEDQPPVAAAAPLDINNLNDLNDPHHVFRNILHENAALKEQLAQKRQPDLNTVDQVDDHYRFQDLDLVHYPCCSTTQVSGFCDVCQCKVGKERIYETQGSDQFQLFKRQIRCHFGRETSYHWLNLEINLELKVSRQKLARLAWRTLTNVCLDNIMTGRGYDRFKEDVYEKCDEYGAVIGNRYATRKGVQMIVPVIYKHVKPHKLQFFHRGNCVHVDMYACNKYVIHVCVW